MELKDYGGNLNTINLSKVISFGSNGGKDNLELTMLGGSIMRFRFNYYEFKKIMFPEE